MATIDEYLNLIPSANRQKPNFIATVTLNCSVQVRVQNLLEAMQFSLFDLELAVGDQLDILGEWAGISRSVNVPVAGIYFSWDGTDPSLGWDFGVWKGPFDGSITVLPDEQYRTLIKAKIAANNWNGTTDDAYRVWDALFTNITILIQDHMDMSYDLAFVGGIVDSLTFALIQYGYIALKPQGVRVNQYFIPIDSGPLFGWDLDSDFVKGWDTGSWTKEAFPVTL